PGGGEHVPLHVPGPRGSGTTPGGVRPGGGLVAERLGAPWRAGLATGVGFPPSGAGLAAAGGKWVLIGPGPPGGDRFRAAGSSASLAWHRGRRALVAPAWLARRRADGGPGGRGGGGASNATGGAVAGPAARMKECFEHIFITLFKEHSVFL